MSAADRGAESPEGRRRRSEAVAWLRALLGGSGLPLPPPRASDDDLRAALADGALLRAALRRLAASAPDEAGRQATAESDAARFVAAVERMGLPSFAVSDLERGPMSDVITCLLALRDRFGSHDGEGMHPSLEEKVRMQSMEFSVRENGNETQSSSFESKQINFNLQKVLKSPATSEPSSPISQIEVSSMSRHPGHNFHEVFHIRQGVYCDMPISKILEVMKSTRLDNAPTQSLLSFVNGILDEIIETKNGEIPYHLACLLRKVILEIERRISTQADHIRNQNNLMRAREEKYKSRIRVLEALASGTVGQTEVNSSVTNGKSNVAGDHMLQMKLKKDKNEEGRLVDKDMTTLMKDKEDVTRLTKDKEDMVRLLKDKEDIIRLMKEKEEMATLIKEKEDLISLKKGKVDDRNQSGDEHVDKSIMYKDEIIRMIKEKENSNHTIMKLKLQLEALKSLYEESQSLLESKKEDVLKLLKDKENSDNVISKLREELAVAGRHNIQELESRALQSKEEFEQRVKEVELILEDSRKRGRDLEEMLKSRIETWEHKEIMVNQFVGLQIKNIQDLRLSSVSIRDEIQNCQKRWSEELSGLGQSIKVLINDAESYHVVLEENKKLFNEIQELKGNIRVFCRIRPFLPGEDQKSTTIEYAGDNGDLVIANPTRQGKEGSKSFKFNKVLGPTASQDEVFKDIQPLIRSVLDGYNVCIFAYGQTGSGKTYTMTGPEDATEEEWGVNYRALNDLFHISRNRGDTMIYEISVQMIEIYNEQIRDLLGSNGLEKKLGISNASQPNGLAVPDATLHPVDSTADVIELMRTGFANRAVGSTALNERSSRSHSVVTIHIRGVDLKTGATLRSALHLIDLAGSERVDRSAVTGDRLKEAQHINKSLSALGDVIFSLSQKNAHVPYRNSKLTQVLQSSLGGHAKTLMFVQVNPDASSHSETLSTLKFAERVSGVELGAAKANKEGKDIREFMEQLALLKHKIAKKDEEISRLQLLKAQVPRARTAKRADSPLKHSSSSPGISSLGSKIQHRRTASSGKAMSIGSKAGSDVDNFSDISDRHSESGSMQSVDDIRPQRGIKGLPKISVGEIGRNSADPEFACFGYADSEERLSDISDSGLSMGTETDGSISSIVELTLFPEQEKTSSILKEQEKVSRTPNERVSKVATRVQKTTASKTAQTSSLWPKLRDPPAPRSPLSAGRISMTPATSAPKTSCTSKRWT